MSCAIFKQLQTVCQCIHKFFKEENGIPVKSKLDVRSNSTIIHATKFKFELNGLQDMNEYVSTNSKPSFDCYVCQKAIKRRNELKQHIFTHFRPQLQVRTTVVQPTLLSKPMHKSENSVISCSAEIDLTRIPTNGILTEIN